MIFERNLFTTAVSIPKSFHLAIEALYSEKIDQPYCLIIVPICVKGRSESFLQIIGPPLSPENYFRIASCDCELFANID